MGARTRRVVSLFAIPVAVAVVLTTGGSVPSAAAPTVSKADPPAAKIPARYLQQEVEWQTCDFDRRVKRTVPNAPTTRCASIEVPMDWLHPDDHPDIQLAIAWSKASGSTKGVLTFNPGGPGVPALDQTAELAQVKPKLFAAYDLLGFDPRGYGESQAHTCFSTEEANDARATVPDPRVRNVKTHEVEVANAKFFGAACSVEEFSQFVSTQQTVYDMEFLRRYLGQDAPAYNKFNFVGISYGTWLGAWYADTYPAQTGRFILDSNLNWTSTMYANQVTDSFSFQRRLDEMFFPWVARHHSDYGLGKTTAQVKASYTKLRGQLSKAAASGDPITDPVDFDNEIIKGLLEDRLFPELASYVAETADETAGSDRASGDGKVRKPAYALRAEARLRDSAAEPNRRSASTKLDPLDNDEVPRDTVRCNDSTYSRDLTSQLKRADAEAKTYPFYGYYDTVTMCSYWKWAAVSRTIDLAGAPTMLMVQSEGDPQTAYEGAAAAHQATAAHTRLVSVDNEGEHGVYSYGVSSCADKIGDAFLLDGVLPSGDTVCAAQPMPMDSKVYKLNGPVDGKSYPLSSKAAKSTARQTKATQQRQESKVDVAVQSMNRPG